MVYTLDGATVSTLYFQRFQPLVRDPKVRRIALVNFFLLMVCLVLFIVIITYNVQIVLKKMKVIVFYYISFFIQKQCSIFPLHSFIRLHSPL